MAAAPSSVNFSAMKQFLKDFIESTPNCSIQDLQELIDQKKIIQEKKETGWYDMKLLEKQKQTELKEIQQNLGYY